MDPSTEYKKYMTKESIERTGDESIHNPAPGGVGGKSMRPGGGGRFARLKRKLSGRKGVYNPGGLAAYIGRKKYGKKQMAEWSAAGRRRAK
jgi:hypothetical protein